MSRTEEVSSWDKRYLPIGSVIVVILLMITVGCQRHYINDLEARTNTIYEYLNKIYHRDSISSDSLAMEIHAQQFKEDYYIQQLTISNDQILTFIGVAFTITFGLGIGFFLWYTNISSRMLSERIQTFEEDQNKKFSQEDNRRDAAFNKLETELNTQTKRIDEETRQNTLRSYTNELMIAASSQHHYPQTMDSRLNQFLMLYNLTRTFKEELDLDDTLDYYLFESKAKWQNWSKEEIKPHQQSIISKIDELLKWALSSTAELEHLKQVISS